MTDRTDRIREMERRMDRLEHWVNTASSLLDAHASVSEDVFELSAYYESSQWMEDYEADEAGLLPKDLKRGVLSEDGLYNLLSEYRELVAGLQSIGASNRDTGTS